MRYLVLLPFFIFLISCASSKQVKFDSSNLKDKTYVFSMTEDSQIVRVEKTGTSLGESETPNNIEVFKESISHLADNMNLDLSYSHELNTENLIVANLKKATWFFGFSRATMTVEIEYTLPNGKKVKIDGVYRAFGMGTKKGFLKNAFINANSKVLKELIN